MYITFVFEKIEKPRNVLSFAVKTRLKCFLSITYKTAQFWLRDDQVQFISW